MNRRKKAVKPFGEDALTYVNPQGGRQSISPCALDVVALAALLVGRVLFDGEEKYEDKPQQWLKENWRKIPAREHARHALNHLLSWLAAGGEEHLTHATCRLLFAIEESASTADLEQGKK